mmetsp:Transcript_72395/g.172518  ORF Transcript_72395/g.172518 Transcript_72395/m.172518 type:complete len:235 (+) Transcript_72395:950-1654(+)
MTVALLPLVWLGDPVPSAAGTGGSDFLRNVICLNFGCSMSGVLLLLRCSTATLIEGAFTMVRLSFLRVPVRDIATSASGSSSHMVEAGDILPTSGFDGGLEPRWAAAGFSIVKRLSRPVFTSAADCCNRCMKVDLISSSISFDGGLTSSAVATNLANDFWHISSSARRKTACSLSSFAAASVRGLPICGTSPAATCGADWCCCEEVNEPKSTLPLRAALPLRLLPITIMSSTPY